MALLSYDLPLDLSNLSINDSDTNNENQTLNNTNQGIAFIDNNNNNKINQKSTVTLEKLKLTYPASFYKLIPPIRR